MKSLLLFTIIFLSACSHSPKKAVGVKIGDEYYQTDQASSFELTKSGDKNKIVCESHKKTGSNIKIRTCTTKEQRRLERKEAQEAWLDNNINYNKVLTPPREGGGG